MTSCKSNRSGWFALSKGTAKNVTNGSEATSAQMVKETNTSKLFFLQDFPGFEIFSNGII